MFRNARQWVVKVHRPWRKRLIVAALVLGLPLVLWGVFDYGRYRAGFDSGEAGRMRTELLGTIQSLREANELLRQQTVTMGQARDIDRQAYAEVDAHLLALQKQVLELKEEVAFYRTIVAPANATSGVRVQSLQLKANGGNRGYSYKLVLAQMGADAKPAKGRAKIMIQGMLGRTPSEFSLDKLAGRNSNGYLFQFKYFDESEGDLVLPEAFVPTRVVVEVLTESPAPDRSETVYSWRELTG